MVSTTVSRRRWLFDTRPWVFGSNPGKTVVVTIGHGTGYAPSACHYLCHVVVRKPVVRVSIHQLAGQAEAPPGACHRHDHKGTFRPDRQALHLLKQRRFPHNDLPLALWPNKSIPLDREDRRREGVNVVKMTKKGIARLNRCWR